MSRFSQLLVSLAIAVALMLLPLRAEALPLTKATSKAIAQNFFESGINKMQSGDYQEAIENFTQATQINANFTAAYMNRCLAYLQQSEYQMAIEDCTQALQSNPENPEAYLNRGLAYYRLGLTPTAIADYTRVIQLKPQDYRAYYNRGLARFDQEDYESAIADYNQALRQTPTLHSQALSSVYNDRGLVYLQLGNLTGAIANFSLAIRLNTDDARAYYNRGCACHRQGAYSRAIRDFTQSLQRHPNQAEAYVNRGIARYQLGYQQAALKDLQRGAECFFHQGQMVAYHQTLSLIQKLRQPSPSDSESAIA